MPSRRMLISALGALPLLAPMKVLAEPVLTDDGLWHQDWFLESFLELGDDLQGAAANSKRFAIMWELKGCPYCKETHFVNFAREDVSTFVKSNFEILQLNLIGSRIVTDFDGEQLAERDLAGKYGIRFTPTLQFFPVDAAGLGDVASDKREVARAQGYLKPDHFLKMFEFVHGRHYESGTFRDWLRAQG